MRKFTKQAAVLALGFLGAACATTSASAGEWRFHPERCSDLVEDRLDRIESRRDERYNRGPRDRAEDRADRRESRRDERVTNCPRSAWVWHGSGKRLARPAAAVVYYDPIGAIYFRKGQRGRAVSVVR